jgi:hypothetical protein
MSTARSVALLVMFCACSDDAGPQDAAPPDIDNGSCGATVRFTGEYVDWDSGGGVCGIYAAELAVQGGGERMTTAPNGRFDLCIPDAAVVLVDITPPAAESQCTTPRATYSLPAIAVASKAVITAGGFWSGRGFVTARQAIDATKAQVFVHVNGPPREVSISAAHGPAQARANDAWSSGAIGQDVFFPDVDPAGGATMLSASGAIGAGSIPLVAGKMTNLSIITH